MKLQQYDPKPTIPGVQIIDLDWKYDDGGQFFEIARLQIIKNWKDDTDDIDIINPLILVTETKSQCFQFNYSYVHPAVVKAWHYHKEQQDYWIIPPNQRFIVGLMDSKKKVIMRIPAGIKPQMIVIPPGIFHGIANIDDKPGHMLYIVDKFFNCMDEWRLPYNDTVGEDFWNAENG